MEQDNIIDFNFERQRRHREHADATRRLLAMTETGRASCTYVSPEPIGSPLIVYDRYGAVDIVDEDYYNYLEALYEGDLL